jgi:hypothetical protein
MPLNSDASFDCLFLAHRLQKLSASFPAAQLHLFAYLGCLLWLYRQEPLTDWGYGFVGTELGAPFSREIDSALKELVERGYFLRVEDRYAATRLAEEQLSDFDQLALNKSRVECLQAAYASTAAFSVGMVGSALSNEPELKRAQALPSNRLLLQDVAQKQLYEQFDALRKTIGERSSDLRLPAVVWLTALYRTSERAGSEI